MVILLLFQDNYYIFKLDEIKELLQEYFIIDKYYWDSGNNIFFFFILKKKIYLYIYK